jgi:hypothetical protein
MEKKEKRNLIIKECWLYCYNWLQVEALLVIDVDFVD